PIDAYDTFEKLTQSLDSILANVGQQFKICFN
ncbi:MAG: hypothetical protein ACI9HK_001843, partial [Pirellulaceae bacterium]